MSREKRETRIEPSFNISQNILYRNYIEQTNLIPNSSHTVYKATLKGSHQQIFVKENKYGDPIYSLFEKVLTDLACLFSPLHLTAHQQLIYHEEKGLNSAYEREDLYGLATCDMGYNARAREGRDAVFYTKDGDTLPKDEIPPVFFLKDFKHGFFAELCENSKNGEWIIDWISLASVLAMAYTLEEDDLHKGNIGFYLVQDNGKPKAVFFSIDHDMKLSGSILSYYCPRLHKQQYTKGAFSITERDLKFFPLLNDSENYYWVTRRLWWLIGFVQFLLRAINTLLYKEKWDFFSKIYVNETEHAAFAALADNKEFCTAKWQEFYKHVLIPPTSVREVLSCLNPEANPANQAIVDLFTDALVERQAQLRAVLFSIPEFRDFLTTMNAQDISNLLVEIYRDSPQNPNREHLEKQIAREKELVSTFSENDTPLHAAVRLGDYRFHSTWRHFKEFAAKKNTKNQTALDLAMEMAGSNPANAEKDDIREDYWAIARHLYSRGVVCSKENLEKIQSVTFANYRHDFLMLNKIGESTTVDNLLEILKELGQIDQYCIKMKKQLAVRAVRIFFSQHPAELPETGLRKLFDAVNGLGDKKYAEPLYYIRQLRHHYWIERKALDLMTGSATQLTISSLIRQHMPFSPDLYLPTFFRNWIGNGGGTNRHVQDKAPVAMSA